MAEINAEAELDMSVHPAEVVPAGVILRPWLYYLMNEF